jgi:flagellar basal-body rod protein FlgF
MGLAARDLLQGQNYANVVKERLKLPPGAGNTRQVFPRGRRDMRKTLANRTFPAGTAAAKGKARPERIASAMDNSLLVSLSQQIASFRSMDVIANNLANVSTPGFKREAAKFEEYVTQVAPSEGQTGIQTVSFVKDAGVMRDLAEGNVTTTGATFDTAIEGQGYFAVQTAQGERYTRNGHFSLDASGQIVTSAGNPVMGDGGPITITPDDGDVHIAADGTVSGKNGQIGKLRLVDFPNDRALVKQGESLYSTTQAPGAASDAKVRQGMLESSNVQPVIEISHMIEVMRSYEATATLSKSQEDLMRQAIDKLGTMPN